MQKLLSEGILLNESGVPNQVGYNVKPVIETNRECARPLTLKEWDFYQITDKNYTLQVTFGHVSYAGAINACLFNYGGERCELTLPLIFPLGSLKMPPKASDFCDLKKHTKNYKMDISVREGKRLINIETTHKVYGECRAEIALTYPADDEGILVVTPFEKERQFYHNYKQCCMRADGEINIGKKSVKFSGDDAFSLIDWGRGVLPYRHKWWWGNGSHNLDGARFGFNIGKFGNTQNATENAVFYNGKAHKLEEITCKMTGGYMDKMVFTSSDKRFEFEFTPVFDNYTELNLLIAHNRCHQVFGNFNGAAVLDDGRVLEIKDMFAFVEFAENRW